MASTRSSRRISDSTSSPRTRSSALTRPATRGSSTGADPKKTRIRKKSLRKGRNSTDKPRENSPQPLNPDSIEESNVACLSDNSNNSDENEVELNPEAKNSVEIVIVSSDDENEISNDSEATCTFTKEEMALIENEINEENSEKLELPQNRISDANIVPSSTEDSSICSMQDTILMQSSVFLKPAGKCDVDGLNSDNPLSPDIQKNEPINSVIVYSPEKFVCRNMVSTMELECSVEQSVILEEDHKILETDKSAIAKSMNTIKSVSVPQLDITKTEISSGTGNSVLVVGNVISHDEDPLKISSVDKENLSVDTLNIRERSESRNSHSTSSTISAIHPEDDFYSPGSTDMSMSEDSRSSFREFGSEKLGPIRKARGRVKSRLHPRSARRNKRQSTQMSSSCSPSEDGSVEPPSKRRKRLPSRAGIIWEIGQKLEAVDHNEWYPAKIVEVDEEACEVLIHFEGWSVRFDEWVPMDSPKLRPLALPGNKADAKDKNPTRPQFKANEKVLARWNDGKLYNATITEVYPDGCHFGVLFYDGFSKKLPASALRKMDKTNSGTKTILRHDSVRKRPFARIFKENHGVSVAKVPTCNVKPPKAVTPVPETATKQFVVETDHNQYKCPFSGCTKEFRKENLLHSHMKHYHSSGSSGRASPPSPKKDRFRRPSQQQERKSKETSLNNEEPSVTLDQTENPPEGPQTTIIESPSEKEISPELEPNVPMEADPVLSDPSNVTSSQCTTEESNLTNADDTQTSPARDTKPETSPPKPLRSPRKIVYPVTKMETRHAKPCLFRDDSIYTGYMSYRSLYAKGGKGSRKSGEVKGRGEKNEEEKGDGRRRKRKMGMKAERKQKSEYPDIDDEIAEIKKRRVYHLSESSSKKDESTRESVDYEDEDEDETVSEGNKEEEDDEIVRCICGNEEENGLMFQCEECKTWQHAACFDIENEEDVPETYFCYICVKTKEPSPPAASPQLAVEKDAWLTKGTLASFNFTKEKEHSNGPSAILATHELINAATKSLVVLNGLQHKIQIAKSEDHPDLKYWSKPWTNKGLPGKNECPKVSSKGVISTAQPSEEYLVFDHSYFAQSEGVLDLQEEVVTEVAETSASTTQLPLNLNLQGPTSPVKSTQPAEDPKEKAIPKRRGSARGGRLKENPALTQQTEVTADTETCKHNLKQHIHVVQNNVEHGLDVIENQLNLLEAGLDVSGNEDEDVTPLLKTLKNLCRDLDVVQRFTLL